MTKWLNKIDNVGDSTPSNILQDNLIEYFDWAILDAGGFTNVPITTTGQYGGTKHKLRLVDDPRYTGGQVWEGFRSNWVWQSGLSTTDQPKTITKIKSDASTYPSSKNYPGMSGIFVGGNFQPASGVGTYAYHIDYPNGRIVFDSAIATTSTVTAEFSYKWTKVTKANSDFFREVQYRSGRADGDFLMEGSGDWSQLSDTRLQLPALAIEVVKARTLEPYALGSLTHFVNTDVLFHVLAEDDHERDKLLDIVSLQDGKVIDLFDSDYIGRQEKFPLDYRGMTNIDALQYPDLLAPIENGGYGYSKSANMQLQNARVQLSEPISPNLYHGVVRLSTELVM
jgi:hypothetical protein|tara:strand:+ start:1345 stop:2361 length:1017 start_codon:yes stop_codon:yes gene_type:complete